MELKKELKNPIDSLKHWSKHL